MKKQNDLTKTTDANVIEPNNWVIKHADYLYGYVITRINDEELARDLVQETFLAALEKVANFEGRSSERTWLVAILKNKVIDVYRKKSSGIGNKVEPISTVEDPADFFEQENGHWKKGNEPQEFVTEAFDPLINKELQQVLKQCMQKLPALWLAIFTMKHVDDAETTLICTELKVTTSNYWIIIHRAKVNLRACLQKNWI